jgi:uncharacterized protein (DUF58 family)
MQVFPTRATVDVAAAGAAVLVLGAFLRLPLAVACAGAIVVALAALRSLCKLRVMRLRQAGFEMVWHASGRVIAAGRGGNVELDAKLGNRDSAAIRYAGLRAICSGDLECTVSPAHGEIPAGGAARVSVTVRTPKVGRHVVHGLALEVRGPQGLFEVPLAFACPIGVEVAPHPFRALTTSARGGRSRLAADVGPPDRRAGDGTDLYELRDHVSGDPFKRIAWKASARRGKLTVRDFEREERDVVWLVLDASVELGAGPIGQSPLDRGIDDLSAIAQRHLGRGDRVGLAIIGSRLRTWMEPGRGPLHASRLAASLAQAPATVDADRSYWDESDVAIAVLEHPRFLDAGPVASVRPADLDAIAAKARAAALAAPFDAPLPWADTDRERTLRRHLACFGISPPPRLEPDRPKTDAVLAQVFEQLPRERPRPSLVYVWSPPPESRFDALVTSTRALMRRGIHVSWIPASHEASFGVDQGAVSRIIRDAGVIRSRVLRERGERVLRALGIRVVRGKAA